MPELLDTLRTYSQAYGPSGDEDLVIRAFADDMRDLGSTPRIDRLGNVIVPVRQPDDGFPHVMLSAHLDEIGFVVRSIERDGFVRVHRVGGVHDGVMGAQRIDFRVEGGFVQGHVALKAKHVSSDAELERGLTVDDAYVDVLAASKEEVLARGIEVGTLGVFASDFGHHGDLVRGKAMDNRAAVAVLVEVARRLRDEPPRAGVTLVGTVQEEFNVRGGVTAARSVAPDLAVCLDVAIATDAPAMHEHGDVRLGAGPAITRFTRAKRSVNGIIPNPKLVRLVKEAARSRGLPLQNAVLQGGLTDGAYMQFVGGGIPTVDLSIPTRYTHTPVETCALPDMHGLVELTLALVHGLTAETDLARG